MEVIVTDRKIRVVEETNLFEKFVHEAFLHSHGDFIFLFRRLLVLHKDTRLGAI